MLEILVNVFSLGIVFFGATVFKQLIKGLIKQKLNDETIVVIAKINGKKKELDKEQLNKLLRLQYLYGLRDAKLSLDKTKTYPKLRRVK